MWYASRVGFKLLDLAFEQRVHGVAVLDEAGFAVSVHRYVIHGRHVHVVVPAGRNVGVRPAESHQYVGLPVEPLPLLVGPGEVGAQHGSAVFRRGEKRYVGGCGYVFPGGDQHAEGVQADELQQPGLVLFAVVWVDVHGRRET
jgi:hypothetical protein